MLTVSVSAGGVRDTSSEHGGEKWPVKLPRERGAKQTGAYEPVRHLGDRRLLSELHPQVRVARSDIQGQVHGLFVSGRAGRCTATGSGVCLC